MHKTEPDNYYGNTKIMFDSMPFTCHLWNREPKMLDCNDASLKMFNVDRKEDFITNFYKFSPEYQPDGSLSSEKALTNLEKAFDDGEFTFDWMHLTSDGKQMPCRVTATRVEGRDEHLVVAYVIDQSEQHAMIKKLSENQRQLEDILTKNAFHLIKLHLMVQATKIGLWDMEVRQDDPVNPNNAFIWSDEFRHMLGFTDETDFPNILSSWSERLHPDDKDKILDAFAKHLMDTTGKTPYDLECRLQKKNGEYAYYRTSGETIRDKDGNAVRVAGALLDITETKKLLLDLETEKFMLQTMFDAVPDLIFCKDTDLNYTRCNESLLRYFDRKKEDIIGKDDEHALGIPEKMATEFRAMDRTVIHDKTIFTYEEYVPGADGAMRLFETSKAPLLLNGKIMGLMGIARDITERKAMEEAAQSANKAKTAFLANMSHEIRTPMNAIIGMGELLACEQFNARQMGYINDIVVSAKSLLKIINDILDFSKVESGKLDLNPVDYDFNAFIDNIESMFIYVAQKKGLEFKLECGENLPDCLYGDDIKLRQVLTNICGNAVKFTEKGYIRLNITASNDSLIFAIKDTGIGIRQRDMARLFNAFEQADKSINRSLVGTGLGLPLSKSFVEMMGGAVSIESEYGYGTVFTIVIPIVEGNAANIRKNEIDKVEQTLSAPDAKILVVDDNEFNLKVAVGLLGLMDIEAEPADSGHKAIELVKQNDYDIVFMDHMMPGMDGIETLRAIKELGGKYADLTIIALTANVVGNVREMFMENGFSDFIAKPIDINALCEILKRHLPPEKIRMGIKHAQQYARLSKEEELFRKATMTFAKENQQTFEKFTASLHAGDMQTAHRIAHTVKSSAAYLGKKDLQEAALSLEQSLQGASSGYTPEQLDAFEKALEKALRECELLLKETASEKPNAVQIDGEKLAALLSALKPLLRKGDFGAASFVEELRGIAGMEELAERIDEYDFEGALQVLHAFEKIETL